MCSRYRLNIKYQNEDWLSIYAAKIGGGVTKPQEYKDVEPSEFKICFSSGSSNPASVVRRVKMASRPSVDSAVENASS